jgi:hypothetical protein
VDAALLQLVAVVVQSFLLVMVQDQDQVLESTTTTIILVLTQAVLVSVPLNPVQAQVRAHILAMTTIDSEGFLAP